MITKLDCIYASFAKAVFVATAIIVIGKELIKRGAFADPIITTYPNSWPMMVAGFALLFIGWRIGMKGPMFEITFILPSAILGLLAAVLAAPKACTAGFNGFNMLACLLMVKPFSSLYYGGYLRAPMPRWATMAQGVWLGAAAYALIACIASYILPPPPP